MTLGDRRDHDELRVRPAWATSLATIEYDSNNYTIGATITGSALGAHAVKHGLVERAPTVSIVCEQGTRTGRQRVAHVKLTYSDFDPTYRAASRSAAR